MQLSKALIKCCVCIRRVTDREEFEAEQVQRMNGEPDPERTGGLAYWFTRRPGVAVIDALEWLEVKGSSPSVIFKHKGSVGPRPSKQPLINWDGKQGKAADDLSRETFLFLLLFEGRGRSWQAFRAEFGLPSSFLASNFLCPWYWYLLCH